MSQRKYVRMSEQSHMQLRLLAATIDRSRFCASGYPSGQFFH